jgi:hypothetical protein
VYNVFFFKVRTDFYNIIETTYAFNKIKLFSCVRVCDYKTEYGLDDLIYWHLIHTTRNYRQLQGYRWSTHFTNRYDTLSLHSPIVVSWQRIYNILTVTASRMKSSQNNSFLAVSSQSFDCHLQGLSQVSQLAWQPSYIELERTHRKHRLSTAVPLLGAVAETCLPSSCLTMYVSSSSTIPAFRSHVNLLYLFICVVSAVAFSLKN